MKPIIRQAITSKYIPPTNTRGARYRAECARGSITVSEDYGLNSDENHIAATLKLIARFVAEDKKQYGTPADKNPWSKPFVSGQIKSGEYVHVFTA